MKHLTIAALMASVAGPAFAQDMTLRFQSSDPAGNPNFQLQQQWAESVSEMSDGAIVADETPEALFAGAGGAEAEALMAVPKRQIEKLARLGEGA